MAVMSEEVARCTHCGSIRGGTAAALDALRAEVERLTRLAEALPLAPPSPPPPPPSPGEDHTQLAALKEAAAREADLLREIRLLQETVARLRGGIVTLRRLDILFPRPTMNRHFHTKGAGVA